MSAFAFMLLLLCAMTIVDCNRLWSSSKIVRSSHNGKVDHLAVKMPIGNDIPDTKKTTAVVQVSGRVKDLSAPEEPDEPVPFYSPEDLDEPDDDFMPKGARLPTPANPEDMTSGELRPVVRAKVKKVMDFIRAQRPSYEQAAKDDDQERMKEIQKELKQQGTKDGGTRGFSLALCNQLWNEVDRLSAFLSYMFCPNLSFPDDPVHISLKEAIAMPASPQRTAHLSEYFWLACTKNHPDCEHFLAPDVEYFNGRPYRGRDHVAAILPVVGWPHYTNLKGYETWKCSKEACIVPIQAWGHQTCNNYARFDANGQAAVIMIAMDCYR